MSKDIKINYSNTFATTHSRDYYRGKSFHYAGEWVEGTHYISDDYNIDFVSKDNALLACAKSHLSTVDNEPKDWIITEDHISGVISKYWDFVLAGKIGDNGKIYVPDYNSETGVLTWELLSENELPEDIDLDLELTEIINQAIEKSNAAITEMQRLSSNLSEQTEAAIRTTNAAANEANRQALAAAKATSDANTAINTVLTTLSSGLQQETGNDTQTIMSQKAVTDALNTKMDKVSSPTVGVVGILDETGNIVDSNVYLSSLVGQEDLSPISNRELEEMLTL